MVVGLAVTCLAALGGFLGAVWLLLFVLGDGSEPEMAPGLRGEAFGLYDPVTGEAAGPFIPMPAHLKTRDEMVAWMTTELPKLTAEQPYPRVPR